jgi:hypothetical protein
MIFLSHLLNVGVLLPVYWFNLGVAIFHAVTLQLAVLPQI